MRSRLSPPCSPARRRAEPARRRWCGALLLALNCAALPAAVLAAGVQPESSVVILNESDGETTMNVRNTEDSPLLLHTAIQNLPEDNELLVVAVPPISRVEAKETQLVRFLMQSAEPIKVQRLKRVTFEGIPPKTADGTSRISMTVRQNLPLIIHPANLPKNAEPWKLLKLSLDDRKLRVVNDSAYVVRLAQNVEMLPDRTQVDIGTTYLLPGSELSVALPPAGSATPAAVRISPASAYGYSSETYDIPLGAAAKR